MSQLTGKNEQHHQRDNATPNFDDNEEFQNIEKQINNQIGKLTTEITTNIGSGLNKLKGFSRQKSSGSYYDGRNADIN